MREQTERLYEVRRVIADMTLSQMISQIKKSALATAIVIVVVAVIIYVIYAYVSGILSPVEPNVSIRL